MSEWRPGDVGLNLRWGYRGIFVENCPQHEGRNHWHNESGYADHDTDARRRLVVIDPDDRDEVERLLLAYGVVNSPGNLSRCIPTMQDALREFSEGKPLIEEPTGLGAVVEDARGGRYVLLHPGERCPWAVVGIGSNQRWQDIDAVRVLAPGWSE